MPLEPGTYRTEPPKYFGTPRSLWGFRLPAGSGGPRRRAERFLREHRELLGLEQLALRHDRTLHSLGATHVIFQQRYYKTPIHRGYVTVHISRDNHVYLCKNAATPKQFLPGKLEFAIDDDDARKSAAGTSESRSTITATRPWSGAGSTSATGFDRAIACGS